MSKEALRQAMPTVAAIVDEFRHLMADGGRLIYAEENGHVIDRREPVNPDSVWVIPPDFKPYIPKEKQRG
jgi:hypothetical protein